MQGLYKLRLPLFSQEILKINNNFRSLLLKIKCFLNMWFNGQTLIIKKKNPKVGILFMIFKNVTQI